MNRAGFCCTVRIFIFFLYFRTGRRQDCNVTGYNDFWDRIRCCDFTEHMRVFYTIHDSSSLKTNSFRSLKKTFAREKSMYLACNFSRACFTNMSDKNCALFTCEDVWHPFNITEGMLRFVLLMKKQVPFPSSILTSLDLNSFTLRN